MDNKNDWDIIKSKPFLEIIGHWRSQNDLNWTFSAAVDVSASCLDQYCSPHEFCGERNGDISCICRANFAYKHRSENTLGKEESLWFGKGNFLDSVVIMWSEAVRHPSGLHVVFRWPGGVHPELRLLVSGYLPAGGQRTRPHLPAPDGPEVPRPCEQPEPHGDLWLLTQ